MKPSDLFKPSPIGKAVAKAPGYAREKFKQNYVEPAKKVYNKIRGKDDEKEASERSNMPNEFPNEAVEVLAKNVHDGYFFQKLARDWNVIPRSQDEGAQLLELAAMVRSAKEAQVKTASAAGNVFLQGAIDHLKGSLQDQGYPTSPTSDVMAIKQAAQEIAKDPKVAEAALKYASYLFENTAE